jgi:hypothetical protein
MRIQGDNIIYIFGSSGSNMKINKCDLQTGEVSEYSFQNTMNYGSNSVKQARFFEVSALLGPMLAFVGPGTQFHNNGASIGLYSSKIGYIMSLNPELVGTT